MEQARVSIGLPVFNGEKYLQYAIDSILRQTYEDFKLIISDNASTDRTQQICQDYASTDRRIAYFRSDLNLGAAPNFNRVFQLSSSPFFKWSAYDDMLEADFLSKCVEALDQHPKAVLCFSRVKIVDENGSVKEKYIPAPETVGIEPHQRFHNLILYPHLATQFYGLIRSEALRRTSLHGNFPSADEVFLAELGFLGEFYEIPDYLFLLRKHSEQSTEGIFQVQRSRTVWFDTSLKGKVLLPKWIYFFACLRAIRNSGLSASKRAYCYRQMMKWVLIPAHFRAMGKDVLIAGNQIVGQMAKRASKKKIAAT